VLVLETERLRLRHFNLDDVDFIVSLLNEPSFRQHIGDKGVRTPEDAGDYLRNGPIDGYARFGYGLNLVELKDSGVAIGMCGLVRRDDLEYPDIGYAFLEKYRAQGYARESAEAVMKHARKKLGINRIVAIVTPDNESSIRLLEKIGLTCDRMIRLANDDQDLKYFVSEI
jgi:ribosomal-protein-alanine N-acetyltransferase